MSCGASGSRGVSDPYRGSTFLAGFDSGVLLEDCGVQDSGSMCGMVTAARGMNDLERASKGFCDPHTFTDVCFSEIRGWETGSL